MTDPITNDTAKALRKLWFDYLDTVAPHRPKLHAYCLRLTGSVWDAEDLLQETLLRGFATIGRGDLHGEHSLIANSKAYLARTATNFWIDTQRRRKLEVPEDDGASVADPASSKAVITPAAGAALFNATAPQERAAIVLKEVFDFSLEEIADLLSTTVGAVKSALHRGRKKLEENASMPPRTKSASPELIDRFVTAFNNREVENVLALLLESVSIEVPGVGGGRGRGGVWVPRTLDQFDEVSERHAVFGEQVLTRVRHEGAKRTLCALVRLEEVDGHISRIVDYHYCADTLALAADALGMAPPERGYHQPPDVLVGMIASTDLPWRKV